MAVGKQGDAHREPGREPAMSLLGWRKFVEEDPPVFELASPQDLRAMTGPEREDYNDARIAYHSALRVVRTESVDEITNEGRLLTLLNQRESGARRGLVVSGCSTTGKTTALKQLGRTHELVVRRRHPGGIRIPVVYVTAPPKGSPRKLAMEFARFLNLPMISPRHTSTDVTSAVCQIMVEGKVDLVLVDEIHNMNLGTTSGEEFSDHLKYFTEHLPATFVYAGIDVEASGLFTGIRGEQIAGRCVLVNTTAFPRNEEWRQLIASMEATVRLHLPPPTPLVDLADYLHHRTGGMIGSLSHLIRAAAIKAILDRSEQITKKSLDKVRIDHQATRRNKPGPGQAAK